MIEDLLRHLLSKAEEEETRHKQPIGKVTEALKSEYSEWREQREELEAEMEFRQERLRVKMERELEREFRARFEALSKEKETLWKKIREEVRVIGDDDLNIDPHTGVVSRWVDKIDFKKY